MTFYILHTYGVLEVPHLKDNVLSICAMFSAFSKKAPNVSISVEVPVLQILLSTSIY